MSMLFIATSITQARFQVHNVFQTVPLTFDVHPPAVLSVEPSFSCAKGHAKKDVLSHSKVSL